MIKDISSEQDLQECTDVIRDSFKTVAEELNLTWENAPTHTSFITPEKIRESVSKGVHYSGLYINDKMAGCIAIEAGTEEGVFYLERFAVIPGHRHKGYGKKLLDYALSKIKGLCGRKVSVAIINEQTVLKKYYLNYGFKETGIKKFPHLPFTVCFMEKNI